MTLPGTVILKSSMLNRFDAKIGFHGQPEKTAKNEISLLLAPPPSRHRPRVAFFFGYFLLGEARKKYARTSSAENKAYEEAPAPQGRIPKPIPTVDRV
ncbi:MAG: hypothetical protein Q8N89_08915 [Azonexus sp.]|nr:hypothetical protein [Azonexus sp.]